MSNRETSNNSPFPRDVHESDDLLCVHDLDVRDLQCISIS